MTTKDTLTLMIAGAGSAVALATFIKAVVEFRHQGRQRRAEQFFAIGRRMNEWAPFEKVCELLDREAAGDKSAVHELAALPSREKFMFLGAYEELALVVRSGLIRREVAHYMHGYYAILCLASRGFWEGPDAPYPKSSYWTVFTTFAEDMKRIERSGMSERRLRF